MVVECEQGPLLGSLRLGLVSVVAFLTLGYLLVRGVRDPIAVPDDRS
jgi:hypothetical protein